MRRTAIGAALTIWLLAAPPAGATLLPPIDVDGFNAGWEAGVLNLGTFVTIGPLSAGYSRFVTPLPELGFSEGRAATFGWRLSPLEPGRPAWGLGFTAGWLTPETGEAARGWAVHPNFVVAFPLFDGVMLRAAAGPMFFTGVSAWEAVPDSLLRRQRGVAGFLPVVPSMELGWRLGGGELILSGFPHVATYRWSF